METETYIEIINSKTQGAPLHQGQLNSKGYTIVENIFREDEIEQIIIMIDQSATNNSNFRKSADLFAIRQFLKEIPQVAPLIFNKRLLNIIQELFGPDYFLVKSIYFDKPPASNWFVAWHQDLTISVNKKMDLENYTSWTVKQNQFAVQPPLEILQSVYTVRIHLDNTDENNGALHVIPGSHLKGILRPEAIDHAQETASTCNVTKGGIMIMKPLLLHSSGRTTNQQKRRVIHLEFTNRQLPAGLKWAEQLAIQ